MRRWKRVVCFGIDGLDPGIVRVMMNAGLLPNFRKLASEGTFTSLATCNPAQSPVVWASLATGCNPGKHGIFDFVKRSLRDYSLSLSLFEVRPRLFGQPTFIGPMRAKTFWEIAAERGVPHTVLRWPVTFPPTETKGSSLAGL